MYLFMVVVMVTCVFMVAVIYLFVEVVVGLLVVVQTCLSWWKRIYLFMVVIRHRCVVVGDGKGSIGRGGNGSIVGLSVWYSADASSSDVASCQEEAGK